MNRVLHLSIVTVSLLAGGCAIPLTPLDKITYPGTVSVSSSMSARVVVIPGSGIQRGSIGGPGASVLSLLGSVDLQAPEINREFARRFDELLRKELTRLGLFGTIVDANDKRPADMVITVFYADLVVLGAAHFKVDVEMRLTGGSQPFWNRYQVQSSERDTNAEYVFRTAWGQEEKTHKLLLERVIPDIEAYVAANNRKPLQPGK